METVRVDVYADKSSGAVVPRAELLEQVPVAQTRKHVHIRPYLCAFDRTAVGYDHEREVQHEQRTHTYKEYVQRAGKSARGAEHLVLLDHEQHLPFLYIHRLVGSIILLRPAVFGGHLNGAKSRHAAEYHIAEVVVAQLYELITFGAARYDDVARISVDYAEIAGTVIYLRSPCAGNAVRVHLRKEHPHRLALSANRHKAANNVSAA